MQKMEDNGGAGVVMVGIQKWSFNVEPFEEKFFVRKNQQSCPTKEDTNKEEKKQTAKLKPFSHRVLL